MNRFRTADVSVGVLPSDASANTDGDLQRACLEQLSSWLPVPDEQDVQAMLQTVRDSADEHRAYSITRLVAGALVGVEGGDEHDWALRADMSIGILAPLLFDNPFEPELLNLLGAAYYELGYTPVARRIFQAALRLEPDHEIMRRNLAATKQRSRDVTPDKLAATFRGHAEDHHARVKRMADAIALPDATTISLCMIVKDEEEMLPGCLEAAAPWVDEIILVDTGSTDRTIEIAQSHDATVIEMEWTGSFSDARNRSVEDATGEWILYLDADEHLIDDDGEVLREYSRRSWLEGVSLVEYNYTGRADMSQQTNHNAMRMFRNRPTYRWKGRIHEQKLWAFPTYLPERFAMSSARLNHYGYLTERINERDKRSRNLELLDSEASEGTDPFTEFNLGTEYSGLREWSAARAHFEQSLELLTKQDPTWNSVQYAPALVSRLVTVRRVNGDLEGSRVLAAEALQRWPDFTDVVLEMALCHLEVGELQQAMACADKCLELGDAPSRYVANAGTGTYQARLVRARALHGLGHRSEAREDLELALDETPSYAGVVSDLVDLLMEEMTPEEVAAYIEDRIPDPTSSVLLILATAVHEHGAFDLAKGYYEQLIGEHGADHAARIGLSEIALLQHDLDEALAHVADIEDDDVLAPRAARTKMVIAAAHADAQAADEAVQMLEQTGFVDDAEVQVYRAWADAIGKRMVVVAPGERSAETVLSNLDSLAKMEQPDAFETLHALLEQAIPDVRTRRMALADLYLRRNFADMAAEEYLAVAGEWGPDAHILAGLGKAATMKGMFDDASIFLEESLHLEPEQAEVKRLLGLIATRQAAG